MKRLKFHRAIVAIVMMLIGWLPSLAHHFEINGVFYNVISTSEVEVTYKGSSYNEFYNEYNGSVVIPSLVEYGGFTYSVTSIGDNAFSSCDLTSIEIPNSVTTIGDYAFVYCSSLTSIQIPNSVTSIGDYVFYYCSSLTSIQIPNSVTSIGDYTFSNCSSLTSVIIGNSVTSIGDYAFSNCSSLTSVIIGNSVTSIGYGAFVYCSSLTSIQIPNSVTSIGEWALGYCSSLTSIEIPNSVTSIGYGAFAYCSSLASIVVDGGNTIYDSRNGCNAIIETTSNTLIAGCKNTIIPNSVTSIGEWALGYCSSLTSIEIPNSVTSIGDDAFSWCDLTEIKCWATTPPTIYSNTFSNYSADLYVPVGRKAAYESAQYWKKFNIINDTLDNPITLNDNNVTVASIGDYIVVKNATVGSVVRVYTADGAMIASEFATEGDVIIEAPAKGIYVVKVGKQTVKVII